MELPKILVCSPTAKAKNYCFKEWLDNVMSFTYPNFEIRLFDNTNDNGKNANILNQIYTRNYGYDKKFFAYDSMIKNNAQKTKSVIEKMCISHNDCKSYAIEHKYDYILHLESDVFPDKNIIQRLLEHNKLIVGGIYYRDEGKYRKVMIQRRVNVINSHIISMNFDRFEDIHFLDGTLKQVAHLGLGCVLINTKVFSKINFRFVKNESMHPDSYFAEDCFRNEIKIYADTSCIARHENQAWGLFGVNYD
jgi:hypothetical protein